MRKRKAEVCGVEQGMARLEALVRAALAKRTGTVVVLVAGGSASGKTTVVAKKLKDAFADGAVIVTMDDYYRGRTYYAAEEAKGNPLNWDQPEALNLPLFRKHLSALKAGKSVMKPVYSFKTGEPVGTEELRPRRVMIVDGLFALDGAIESEGDVNVFVEIGMHGRVLRRLMRDVERSGQRPADILDYFAATVEPMHAKYIEPTKKNADLVIVNEYAPETESGRSGMRETQLKFAAPPDAETLRKAGAERLGTVVQTDTYCNPADRNLAETGEILRIREEGDRWTLTYKGPKMAGEFRERQKFEFDIDADTGKKFLAAYGVGVKSVRKERTLYQCDGAVFSIDKVVKTENGAETDLGAFLEIRSVGKGTDIGKLRETLAKLGLVVENGVKESYFDM